MSLYSGSKQRSVDAALEVVSNRRRRAVLRYLRETPDGVGTFEDCVTAIITDSDEEPDAARIRTRLCHKMLPKLEEAGVVAYDSRRKSVRYQSDATVEHLLDTADELSDARRS